MVTDKAKKVRTVRKVRTYRALVEAAERWGLARVWTGRRWFVAEPVQGTVLIDER